MGEGGVERVDVLEIGQMRDVLAQGAGVERILEQLPAQRTGLRTLAESFERPDFQAATLVGRPIARRETDVNVGHR